MAEGTFESLENRCQAGISVLPARASVSVRFMRTTPMEPGQVGSSSVRTDHALGEQVPPLDPHGAVAGDDTLGAVDPPPATAVATSQARDQTGRLRGIDAGVNLPAALAGPDRPPAEDEKVLRNHV